MFPEDCVQSIISTDSADWWIKNNEKALCRGALVFAFVPFKMNFKEVPLFYLMRILFVVRGCSGLGGSNCTVSFSS